VGIEARRVEYAAGTAIAPTASIVSHGALNPVSYFAPDGASVTPRRTIVELSRCNTCHDQLAAHGNLRQNVEYCVMCHTPNATDASVRPMSAGAPASIEFQSMIHRIHMGASLPSVQSGTPWVVYGFGGAPSDFSNVEFPQSAGNCVACHAPGTQQTPRARACTSCHDDPSTLAHAQLNTTASGAEACETCHGPGRIYSVDAMHPPTY
jgi:OmcA/MtrC family decaheme c-type cytochrome